MLRKKYEEYALNLPFSSTPIYDSILEELSQSQPKIIPGQLESNAIMKNLVNNPPPEQWYNVVYLELDL